MAITSAVCNSFKTEVLQAIHNFTASSGNTFNLALYTSSATLNKSTTAYSSSNEISNTSGSAYSAKGKALTSVTPAYQLIQLVVILQMSLGLQHLSQLMVV